MTDVVVEYWNTMVMQAAVVECNGVGLWNLSTDFEVGLILLDSIPSVYCSCWWIKFGFCVK